MAVSKTQLGLSARAGIRTHPSPVCTPGGKKRRKKINELCEDWTNIWPRQN